jgi:hypothetical protein
MRTRIVMEEHCTGCHHSVLLFWMTLRSYFFSVSQYKTLPSSQAADFFDTGIQWLISRYKCLNSGGDFVEKQLKYVCILVYNIFLSLLVLLTHHRMLLSEWSTHNLSAARSLSSDFKQKKFSFKYTIGLHSSSLQTKCYRHWKLRQRKGNRCTFISEQYGLSEAVSVNKMAVLWSCDCPLLLRFSFPPRTGAG